LVPLKKQTNKNNQTQTKKPRTKQKHTNNKTQTHKKSPHKHTYPTKWSDHPSPDIFVCQIWLKLGNKFTSY